MTWNYRVVRREIEWPGGDTEVEYAIHEAYYDDDVATSITTDGVSFCADSEEELREVLGWALGALDKPTLRWEDF